MLLRAIKVLEPVMDLKLDPGGRQQIDDCSWFEGPRLSGKQPFAYNAGIWVHQLFVSWSPGMLSRNISTKSHTRTAHTGPFKIIEFAIRVPYT